MKNIVFTLLLIGSGVIYSQNSITTIPGFDELFNLNIEEMDTGGIIFSGAYFDQATGWHKSLIGRMDNTNTVLWTRELYWFVNSTFVVADHVILPSGNIAVAGIAGNSPVSGLLNSFPIILMLDANGNSIPQAGAGYIGNNIPPNATVHKIEYSDFTESLIVVGSFNNNHPLQVPQTNDRTGFVMSVDLVSLNVNWCSSLDMGSGGNDIDFIDSIVDLGPDGIFVAGSLTGGNQGLLLVARLDNFGNTIYAHTVEMQRHTPFAADAVRTGDNILVLANDIDGMMFLCVDIWSGNINNAMYDTPFSGGMLFTGHNLQYEEEDGYLSLMGYIVDNNFSPALLYPFKHQFDYVVSNCGLYPFSNGQYFDATNINVVNNYYQQLGNSFDFINTPDMGLDQNGNFILIGLRNNDEIDVDRWGLAYSGDCITDFNLNLVHGNPFITNSMQFNEVEIEVYNDGTLEQPVGVSTFTQCQTDPCPLACPVSLNPVCGFEYELSVNCVHSIYSPQYSWNIPGISITGSSISGDRLTIESLGGTYTYTITATVMGPNGPQTCPLYTGTITIPTFNCGDLMINETITHVCDEEFLLELDVDPSCFPYNIIDVDLFKPFSFGNPFCSVISNQTSNSILFDLQNCGYGTFQLNATIEITDGFQTLQCNKYFVSNTAPPLVGPYTVTINDECTDNVSLTPPQFVIGTPPIDCLPGATSYLDVSVTQPLGSCYEYYWNGSSNPSGPTYYCCDNDPACFGAISLLVVDTCNCCEYFIPNIYNQQMYSLGIEIEISNSDPKAFVDGYNETIEEKGIDIENRNIIYPNPTSGKLKIDIYDGEGYEIILQDINGNILEQLKTKEDLNLDISNYSSGIYLVIMINEKTLNRNTERIIKIN